MIMATIRERNNTIKRELTMENQWIFALLASADLR